MFIPNHLQLIVKGYFTHPPTEVEILNKWFNELVTKVRMKTVAGPTSVFVDEPGNEGLTGTVTLSTSHASLHIWSADVPSLFQFDIYSCSCFTPEEVLEHLDVFGLFSFEWVFIDRNDGIKIVSEGNSESTD